MPKFGYVIVSVYVLLVTLTVVFQGKLIFPAPTSVPAITPADKGLAFEDLRIPVDRKTFVRAWWIPSKQPSAKVILYFHGNASALAFEAEHEAELLHETGANLLLVEYRGYPGSSPLQTSGTTTASDALAALHYLQQERHIALANIVICGWSVGSGVAAQLARDAPGAGGLILVSPITSVPDVANSEWLFKYLLRPAQWLRHDNDFATKDKIGSIHMPVFFMTGTEDVIAPPWMAKELFARANEPKSLRLIDEADHNDIMQMGGHILLEQMKVILGR
jgi:uncharacterized protein